MNKKNIKAVLLSFFMVFVLCLPFFVFAQVSTEKTGIMGKLQKVGTEGGFATADETSLAKNLGLIVNTILSLLGVIFIILIVISGFKWMTASGNEKQVEDARKNITNAIIGLVITVSSYAIWRLIERFFIKMG